MSNTDCNSYLNCSLPYSSLEKFMSSPFSIGFNESSSIYLSNGSDFAEYNLTSTDPGIKLSCLNHPDSVLSFETSTKIDRTIQWGLIPSFFLIGAPTNVLNMVVFYRQGLRDRMNLCLFCLAFVDLMYVTAVFITVFYCFIGMVIPSEELFWRWTLLSRALNFIYGSLYLSGCLTMIIAVERCVCVMFPMKASTLISTKTMARVLALNFLLIHGLCIVYAIKEQVSYVTDPFTGVRIFVMVNTQLFLSHSFLRIIENIVLSAVSFICFTVVLISTIITVVQLHHAVSWRKSTASGSSYLKSQAVLMRMLLVLTSIYVLCTAPNVVLALTRFTVSEFRIDGAQCSLFLISHTMGLIFCMFNSSINFFVYSSMSSYFRQEMKTLFTGQRIGSKVKSSKA